MNKLSIVAAAMFLAGSAYAADEGTLTFHGVVLSDSCSITTDGGADQVVSLPSAHVSDFGTVGSQPSSTATSFNIKISGCEAQTYVISFPSVQNTDKLNGDFINNSAATAAAGVDLVLYDGASASGSNYLKLSQNPVSSSKAIATEDDEVSFPFTVNYYQTGSSISAGNVQGQLKYQIKYN